MKERFPDILYPLDTKESVLKFVQKTEFRKAPNPIWLIHKAYCKKSGSKIQFDDFKRIILELLKDEHLEKSVRDDNGEENYFLLSKKEKTTWQKYPFIEKVLLIAIATILSVTSSLLLLQSKDRAARLKEAQQDSAIKAVSDSLSKFQKFLKDSSLHK